MSECHRTNSLSRYADIVITVKVIKTKGPRIHELQLYYPKCYRKTTNNDLCEIKLVGTKRSLPQCIKIILSAPSNFIAIIIHRTFQ